MDYYKVIDEAFLENQRKAALAKTLLDSDLLADNDTREVLTVFVEAFRKDYIMHDFLTAIINNLQPVPVESWPLGEGYNISERNTAEVRCPSIK